MMILWKPCEHVRANRGAFIPPYSPMIVGDRFDSCPHKSWIPSRETTFPWQFREQDWGRSEGHSHYNKTEQASKRKPQSCLESVLSWNFKDRIGVIQWNNRESPTGWEGRPKHTEFSHTRVCVCVCVCVCVYESLFCTHKSNRTL